MRHDQMLVVCVSQRCEQYNKRKVVTMLHLGQGIYQSLEPVCGSCGFHAMIVAGLEKENDEPRARTVPEVSGAAQEQVPTTT